MPGVPGSLFEEMADDPAKIDDRLTVGRAAEFVERRLRDQSIGFGADGAVATYRGIERRLVFSQVCSVQSGEASKHPRGFGVCDVVDQPQKRRAGSDRRGRRLGVIDSVQLLQQRVPLIRKQRGEDDALVTGDARRLLVWHDSKLSRTADVPDQDDGAMRCLLATIGERGAFRPT